MGANPCAPPTAADQRAGCHPGKDESKCVDYKKKYGPDPSRPGHCIEHKKDPMADGRFGNDAGELGPMDYWPKLAARLLPRGKRRVAPPAPPTPAEVSGGMVNQQSLEHVIR
eukprot:gene596-21207_t